MKKGTNKTDNYFERVKQRLHPPKYRYYFFDYLYFKGEQWSTKAFRCSGTFILLEYWIMIVAFPAFGFTSVTHHFGDNAVIFYQVLILLLPYIFIFFRYRKDRKKAIINHYRHSKSSGVTMTFIIILPFILFFFELWLFDKLEWIDCKLW